MNNPGRIAILLHANDEFERHYLMNRLAERWMDAGHEVVVLKGVDRFEPAAVLIMHVNLTVIPKEYLVFAARYPVVVNGGVRDISKRRVSANLVRRHEAYQGPVIVKTDRNYGGLPEQRFLDRGILRRLWRMAQGHLPWSMTDHLEVDSYPIYPSPAEVPRLVWRNPSLVVEKYRPEREGELYALRQWVFFGNREASVRILSPNPVIKASSAIDRVYGIEIPDGLRAIRKTMGFDYGKFDFGVVDGECVLYDTNWTPTIASKNTKSPIEEDLAQGMTAFIPEFSRPAVTRK